MILFPCLSILHRKPRGENVEKCRIIIKKYNLAIRAIMVTLLLGYFVLVNDLQAEETAKEADQVRNTKYFTFQQRVIVLWVEPDDIPFLSAAGISFTWDDDPSARTDDMEKQ